MDQAELTEWALRNGWQMQKGVLCLTKPQPRNAKAGAAEEAVVRMVFKGTVVNVEAKKPAGKWEKISGAAYRDVERDAETGLPRGLGFETLNGFARLLEANKDRMMMAKVTGTWSSGG